MKLIILQNKLKQGLSLVERIASKSFSLPVLANVLLRAEKNFLILETTDLEIGIKSWNLAKVEKIGAITIPVSLLSNFVRLLPEKPLNLEVKNNLLLFEVNGNITTLKGLNAEDFPIIPQEKNTSFINIPTLSLCNALEQVVDIPAISSARPEISGIFFSLQKNALKIVATDSFRLAEKTLFLPKPLDREEIFNFILPQKTIREIINIFGEKEMGEERKESVKQKELKIYFGPNQVLIESLMAETSHPQVNLVSRLIEGDYPNYQEIIPQKYETQAILDKAEFLKQIKLASLFSGKINEVNLKINPSKGNITVTSQNPEIGQHQSVIGGKIKGKEKEVSFNYRFLINGLEKIKSSEIIFEITERNGEIGPGVLKPVGDPSYIYVLMPMQTS